jgi:hypothetical protein
VRHEEVLYRVKWDRNILHTKKKKRKANWIGHILRTNCLLKHVLKGKIEERIEVTGRRGRRRKELLENLKEKTGYWKLKEEALDRSPWRTCFERGYRPVVRQTKE